MLTTDQIMEDLALAEEAGSISTGWKSPLGGQYLERARGALPHPRRVRVLRGAGLAAGPPASRKRRSAAWT